MRSRASLSNLAHYKAGTTTTTTNNTTNKSDNNQPSTIRGRIILVGNVLPITLFKNSNTGEWIAEFDHDDTFENGPYLASLRTLTCASSVEFVGVPPINVPLSERAEVEKVLNRIHCHPVFCTAKEASEHFQGVCKSVLWPACHNIIDLYNSAEISSTLHHNDNVDFRNLSPSPISGFPPTNTNSNNNKPTTTSSNKSSSTTTAAQEDIEGKWLPSRSWNPMQVEAVWQSHMDFLSRFRKVIVSLFSNGDVVWVHDYHLIMLLGMLRRGLPMGAPLGFFLHIPFPSSEVFRTVARREDILDSMLSADHIGFHSFVNARNFLVSCQRLSGFSYRTNRGGTFAIQTIKKGRTVTVTCIHASFDPTHVMNRLPPPSTTSTTQKNNSFTLDNRPYTLIVGIDEVEGLRGIVLKLLALDQLLTNTPAMRNGRVRLNQIGVHLNSRPDDYLRCKHEIETVVTSLQTKWGKDVVQYREVNSISLPERLEIYSMADILLCTCVKWGLSADAFEFIAANRARADEAANGGIVAVENPESPPHGTTTTTTTNPNTNHRGPGVVILSEFVSSTRILPGSLRVNPWSLEQTSKAIENAVNMRVPERIARHYRDAAFLNSTNIHHWAELVLGDIMRANFKANRDEFSIDHGIVVLDENIVADSYVASNKRLIVFDYAGVLVPTIPTGMFLKRGGEARSWHYEDDQKNKCQRREGGALDTREPLSKRTMTALQKLASDPRNVVVIVSMDLREELEHACEGLDVTLIAENGYAAKVKGRSEKSWIKIIGEDDDGGDWYGGATATTVAITTTTTINDVGVVIDPNKDWRETVAECCQIFAERTNGSFVFVAPSSVSFNYSLSDPEAGDLQSKSLAAELERRVAGLPVIIEHGKDSVTARRREVDRGAALQSLMKSFGNDFDFGLIVGEDAQNEVMFKVVNETSTLKNKFTVKVGHKSGESSKAVSYLHDDTDVLDLIEKLVTRAEEGDRRAALEDLKVRAIFPNYKPNSGVTELGSSTTQDAVKNKLKGVLKDESAIQNSPLRAARKGGRGSLLGNNNNNNLVIPPLSLAGGSTNNNNASTSSSSSSSSTTTYNKIDDLPPAPAQIPSTKRNVIDTPPMIVQNNSNNNSNRSFATATATGSSVSNSSVPMNRLSSGSNSSNNNPNHSPSLVDGFIGAGIGIVIGASLSAFYFWRNQRKG
jgi:trehalose 6-phosphate synthase/phosphatase